MDRILFFCIIFCTLSCSKSTKDKAFDEFNDGVSISLEAQNAMMSKNYELAEELNKEAILKFENTLKIDTEHKGASSALGHSYYLIKDFQKGIEWYEKAIKIDSMISINHLEYGLCKVNIGDIISGRKSINYAIQLDNSSETKEQAVYSLFDIGVLAFEYGKQFETEGEIEKGSEFKKFGLNVLYVANEIDSTHSEIKRYINDFTNLISGTNIQKDSGVKDFHSLIDLILSHINKKEKGTNSIILKVKSNLPYGLFQNDDYIIKRLEKQTTKILYNNFKSKVDRFELDKTKLGLESNKLLSYQNSENNGTITYTFNGFLMNQSENLVISSITVIYSNKISSKIGGGWHEFVLFQKKDDTWEVLDRIETVEY